MGIKVGDYVKIISSDDTDLEYWLEEQEKNGIKKHKITEIDEENYLFWVENCDYAIWVNEDEYEIIKEEK